MKDDFQENGHILGHGKLGEATEKVVESPGISKAQESTNPVTHFHSHS